VGASGECTIWPEKFYKEVLDGKIFDKLIDSPAKKGRKNQSRKE